MKICIVDSYYQGFLKDFYKNDENRKLLPYSSLKNILLNSNFGTSDYYSFNLKKHGNQAVDLIVNDPILQSKWANENELIVKVYGIWQRIQQLPFIHRFVGRPNWIQKIAIAQIKKYRPEVVYIQDLSILNPDVLKEIKKYCKLLIGQIASSPPSEEYLKQFDLIITSFPHYVDFFRKLGIKSEYQKLAFEPRVLKKIGKQKRIYDTTFIGSFTPYHIKGTQLLEEVVTRVPVHVWGQGLRYLSPLSPLRKNYHGKTWGTDMYKILAQSKLVINRHIGVSEQYANNMRLYESTGMGAMLITDDKKNINDLFEVGKEVIVYQNEKDLSDKIKYYLRHDKERKKIAEAGQRRTLRDHTYPKRMKELTMVINKYL
jgi:spore maturation protein CgeB